MHFRAVNIALLKFEREEPVDYPTSMSWCSDPAAASTLARFFVDNLTPEYISHSELQGPRALAPGKWSDDLYEVILEEIRSRLAVPEDEQAPRLRDQRIAAGHVDNELVWLAYVTFVMSAPRPFAVLEDIVVLQDRRGKGIGDAAIRWILDQCRAEGVKRVFLESGVDNHRGHAFFESHGFNQCSIVMMRDS